REFTVKRSSSSNKNFQKTYHLFEKDGLSYKKLMANLIRFVPLTITSQISFVTSKEKKAGFVLQAIVLIPRLPSGRPVITKEPFPEIYF
ncbi:MAG: hypothetical protein ACM3N9_07115, partial [Syntrophothermus sp.]